MLYDMKKIMFLLIFVAFFFTCKEKKADDTQHKMISLHEDINDCVDSVYFQSTKLVRLETTDNSLIIRIEKIMFDEDKIFIFDKRANSIFVFDSDGKFLYPIKKVGMGPGEYNNLHNVCLDIDNKQLILFPDSPNKIYYMDYSGNLLRQTTLGNNLYYLDVSCYKNEIYAITEYSNSNNNFCYINILDKPDNKETCLFNDNKVRQNSIRTSGSYLTKSKDLNFTIRYENFIYEIVDKKVRKKYEIDFGKYNLPERYKEPDIPKEEIISISQYIYSIIDMVDSENYLAFKTNVPGIYIYSKEEDLLKKYRSIIDSKYDIYWTQMYYIENMDNSVAFVMNPSNFSLIKNAEIDRETSPLNKNKLHLIDSIELDDNPLLLICKFH
jgi:hypothetical protein